jgi:SAM-dependent methyltransferase
MTFLSKKNCAFCDSKEIFELMDFGNVALAGGFLKPVDFSKEIFYPLRLSFCVNCFAVQTLDVVDPSILFHKDYFYASSAIETLRNHFEDYANNVSSRFLTNKSNVLEIGCNDGIFLKPLVNIGIVQVIGVDPARNVVEKINDPRIVVINDFFNMTVAQNVKERFGSMDMIVANNVFAHIPDIQDITRAIYDLLSKDGVFIFEVHYLGKIIDEFQYDMIYHEHLYYYSLLSANEHFKRFDMLIFDFEFVSTHAGSIRFYVCKKNATNPILKETDRIKNLMALEIQKGFDKLDIFQKFSTSLAGCKSELIRLLKKLKKEGKTIYGYGASGRANTIIQFCGLSHELIDCIIDDAPSKIGYFTPGSHFEIVSSAVLYSANKPDFILVFAWSFFDEIKAKNQSYLSAGGKMILPLPFVRIY